MTLLGLKHPVADTLGSPFVWFCVGLCLLAEGLAILLGVVALARPEHRHLIPFIPSMMLYFTLGTLAAYKALWELVRVPFFWDKTQHGVTRQTDVVPARAGRSDR